MKTKFISILAGLFFVSAASSCTIGVASGKATSDGRPLLWKTRDTDARNNEIIFNDSGRFNYIALANAGSTGPWMGVNEKGFAIINSNSKDLRAYPTSEKGPGHSAMMKLALETCDSVADFQALLDKTNVTGRRTSTNFGVIDANGGAVIFETANKQYWKLDCADETLAPNGYIVHANFAFNGSGKNGFEKSWSYERYKRAEDLCKDFYQSNKIDYKEILQKKFRDFADFDAKAFEIPFAATQEDGAPFGYINTQPSICRYYTVSAAVFQGVLPNHDPRLTTMWAILGMPASGIAVPYWPVGKTPLQADGEKTASLCDVSKEIYFKLLPDSEKYANLKDANRYFNTYLLSDSTGDGLLNMIFEAENQVIRQAQVNLARWRKIGPSPTAMLELESKLARQALQELEKISQTIKTRQHVQ